jgi:tetratricopeptide (TPR) repeat protein
LGHPGVLVVHGPPGIGKTALVLEATQSLPGFYWSLDHVASPEQFLDAWNFYLANPPAKGLVHGAELTERFNRLSRCQGLGHVERVLAGCAITGGGLLVLDGVPSEIPPSLAYFFHNLPSGLTLVVTSDSALIPGRAIQLGELDPVTAVTWMRQAGVLGPNRYLAWMHRWSHGRPLILQVAIGLVLSSMRGEARAFVRYARTRAGLTALLDTVAADLPDRASDMLSLLCSEPAGLVLHEVEDMLGDVQEVDKKLQSLGLVEARVSRRTVHPGLRVAWYRRTSQVWAHALLAQHLEASRGALHLHHIDLVERYIGHLLASGQRDTALSFYRERVRDPIVVEWMQYEAAERIGKRLLQAFPDDAALYNEAGLAISRQGRLAEAAVCYQRALKRRLRRRQYLQARGILDNLMVNALQRGRLRLAEHVATTNRRWTVLHQNPRQRPQAQVFVWYSRALQGRASVSPEPFLDQLPLDLVASFLSDIWLRQGRADEAWAIAHRSLRSARREDVKLFCRLRMKQAALVHPLPDNLTELLQELEIEILPAIRSTGHRGWLAEAYLTLGRYRVAGARPDAGEAFVLAWKTARDHGFGLLELDAALEQARLAKDETGLRVAMERAEAMGYAWVQDAARESLGLPPLSAGIRYYRPPTVASSPSDTYWPQSLGGESDPLPFTAVLSWQAGKPPLLLPAGVMMGHLWPTLLSAHVLTTIQGLLARCHDAPQDIDARYELAVLLCLAPHPAAAGLIRCMTPFIEPLLAGMLTLAASPTASSAAALRRTLDSRRDSPAHFRSLAWYDLGVYLEMHGQYREAEEAFRKSLDARARLETLQRLQHLRDSCTLDLESLVESIELYCRIKRSTYPSALDELVPGWWSAVPRCGADPPVFYRVLRNRARFVLGCRRHHQFHDSTLGPLRHPLAPTPRGYGLTQRIPQLDVTPVPEGGLPAISIAGAMIGVD